MFRRWREARRHETSRRRAVDDLARSLALMLEPDALRASIASRVRELIGCESVMFCSFVAEEDAFVGTTFPTGERAELRLRFRGTGSLVNWIRVNEETLVLPETRGVFEHLDTDERRMLTDVDARGCMPILVGHRLLAILVLGTADPTWFLSSDDVELLDQIGRHAGLALQNVELQALERERLRNFFRAEQLAVAGQLAATVAHEVRNPLTAIRSAVQYVLDTPSETATKARMLQSVIEAVDRIDHTIGAVLAISRETSGDFGRLDLTKVAEESTALTEAYARAHEIVVDKHLDATPLWVNGDRRSLQQVCINLFLNACQAMPNGGRITIRCALVQPDLEAPCALFQIHDTGPGIAAEHLAKVFEPFFTTKPGGTGLGLPICLDIVTRHSGKLRLDSSPGQGTTATMLLPLRRD